MTKTTPAPIDPLLELLGWGKSVSTGLSPPSADLFFKANRLYVEIPLDQTCFERNGGLADDEEISSGV